MDDVLIIGGGVVGLSLAYELAGRGKRVRVLDRQRPGQEASWAGAGILPAAVLRDRDHPLEQLAGLSHALHPQWSAKLKEETGIDNGFRRTGGIYLARHRAAADQLAKVTAAWQERGIEFARQTAASLAALEPALKWQGLLSAVWVPDEAQLRNPWHLRALLEACRLRGVAVQAGVSVDDWEVREGCVRRVKSDQGSFAAGVVCICGGAWSKAIVERLGAQIAIKPIRGQIALLNTDEPLLRRVINDGCRYLVPRADGRVLVGSTEEDVGFEKGTTEAAIDELLKLAQDLVPTLKEARLEKCWSGLRPGTLDGLPYLGRLPNLENAFIAAGHFRQGLHLSPGTAVVMSQLLCGEQPQIDVSPFRVAR